MSYSKSPTHRKRLAGGSQSISKCAREIEPTVSQFLTVHGKFSESGVSIGLPPVLDKAIANIDLSLTFAEAPANRWGRGGGC